MASRIMRNTHQRIGWLATSAAKAAKWRVLYFLGSAPGNSPHGKDDVTHLEFSSQDGKTFRVLLTDSAAVELAKGLLLNVLRHRSGPITMTADDEFQSILKQCQKAIEVEDEYARQIAAAVRRGPEPGDEGDPTHSG